MTDYMAILPSDVIKHLSGFLDYNSRVDFNTVVTPECRLVKKINSDAHNLKVKLSLIKQKIKKICSTEDNIELHLKLFGYLINTKDTVLFELKSTKYRESMLLKIIHLHNYLETSEEFDEYDKKDNQLKLNLIRVITRLEKKLNNIPLRKQVKPRLVKIL